MIKFQEERFSREESLSGLCDEVRDWFVKNYKELTPPQHYSFKLISEKKNLLIAAPTGSGKTFSAFTSILSDLISMSKNNELEEKVYCLYVSPLRALNNDIYKNLSRPLDEIYEEMSKHGEEISKVSIGIRTGDTLQKDRQRMLKHPPNILVTTPETLAILLNSPKFAEHLKSIRYLVIDELHELANNKRGVHLSLSVERLRAFVEHDFVRIGLGATLYPLDDAAMFLVGYNQDGSERDCLIVDAAWDKKIEAKTISPVKDIVNEEDSKIENAVYKKLNDIIKKNKTTLIFTNTRSGTERTVLNLMKRFKYKEEQIAAHHGSLSRQTRLEVEESLKKGQLNCVVSSTSLELGIDIGTIDNVALLGSPKSITRAIQRIGRSGHSFKDIAKGEIIVLNRDDLVECSVMLDSAIKRRLDSFSTPKNALDVLAQHIVGMALVKKWKKEEMLSVIKQCYAYHTLQDKDFTFLIEYLAGSYVGLESRRVYAKIWHDPETDEIGRRGKLTKLIYYLNLGTIPDEVGIDVFSVDGKWIGSIEEEFLMRMKIGDIFVLGGKLYRYESSKGMRCVVSRADTKSPTIPPWFSEQLPLSYELALDIGKFRKVMGDAVKKDMTKKSIRSMLSNKATIGKNAEKILNGMPIDSNAKNAINAYFMEQLAYAKYIPNDSMILIEKTIEPGSDRNLIVFHSCYGRRINDALSRAFAIIVSTAYGIDVAITINDNGFVVITDENYEIRDSEIKEVIETLCEQDLGKLLKDNIRRTEMMRRRFRHCAARAFMILRNYKGKKISVRKQHLNSQLLLTATEAISKEFPVLKETYREILEDVMDMPRAKAILDKISKKEIKYSIIKTKLPSPFSHMMITFGEADIVMMKDRRRHLRELHKQIMKKIKALSK